MADRTNTFCWYDLMTSDCRAAEAFYRNVVGWDARDSGVPGQNYTLLSMGGVDAGGLMPIPDEAAKAGVPPAWMGYIAVDDVDVSIKRIEAAGGALMKGPIDIPDILRFAVVADPHGAGFMVFRGMSSMPMPEIAPGTPGRIGWHELYAGDLDEAFAFYSGLFGWTKADVVKTPTGPYQLFAMGGDPAGGMMTKPAHVPKAGWLFYVNVVSIGAAVKRIKSNGGETLFEPMQVPGGSWIVQARDPQGAVFALVSCKA